MQEPVAFDRGNTFSSARKYEAGDFNTDTAANDRVVPWERAQVLGRCGPGSGRRLTELP